MNRQEIETKARTRMTIIEERYHDFVPNEIQSYWLLNYLVAEGIRAYVGSYGLRKLHLGDCNDGRESLGIGPLNGFERDCIRFLNEHCEREEEVYENHSRIGIAAHRTSE